jgi:hypothetical protein
MNKGAHSVEVNNAIYDAPDADHTWSVKVKKKLFLLNKFKVSLPEIFLK